MTSFELYEKLGERYPAELSCEWDNDGIAVSPGPVCECRKVLVSLDATESAIVYAAENGFDTVITHHPMLFGGTKSITPETGIGRKIITAIMNGITVMSFHTRLDAAEGGVNDVLCHVFGVRDVERFGNTECPNMGRIGGIESMTVSSFFDKAKSVFGGGCRCFTPDKDAECTRVAFLGGAGRDFVRDAQKAGADIFVTGEASYNYLLDAAEDGITVIIAGHRETEMLVCETLVRDIHDVAPDIYTEVYGTSDGYLYTV